MKRLTKSTAAAMPAAATRPVTKPIVKISLSETWKKNFIVRTEKRYSPYTTIDAPHITATIVRLWLIHDTACATIVAFGQLGGIDEVESARRGTAPPRIRRAHSEAAGRATGARAAAQARAAAPRARAAAAPRTARAAGGGGEEARRRRREFRERRAEPRERESAQHRRVANGPLHRGDFTALASSSRLLRDAAAAPASCRLDGTSGMRVELAASARCSTS